MMISDIKIADQDDYTNDSSNKFLTTWAWSVALGLHASICKKDSLAPGALTGSDVMIDETLEDEESPIWSFKILLSDVNFRDNTIADIRKSIYKVLTACCPPGIEVSGVYIIPVMHVEMFDNSEYIDSIIKFSIQDITSDSSRDHAKREVYSTYWADQIESIRLTD